MDLGPETWEPHVVDMTYAVNGRRTSTRVGWGVVRYPYEIDAQPILELDPGDTLEILAFRGQVLLTSQSGGLSRVRTDTVPADPGALRLEARVLASVRRPSGNGGGSCWELADSLLTRWVPLRDSTWSVASPGREWVMDGRQDALRLQVQVRRTGEAAIRARSSQRIVLWIAPRGGMARRRWNAGHSVFAGRVDDAGDDRPCARADTLEH